MMTDKLRVVTFQHGEVVKELDEKGIYLCTYEGKFHKATPKSYQFLVDSYRRKKPNEPIIYPIFGWTQVLEVGQPVNECNQEDLDRMLGMTNFKNPYNRLTLLVPRNKVMETDFYGFVDLRCSEEFPEEDPPLTKKQQSDILRPRERGIIEIQAILGYIDKDWVIGVKPLSELL